MDANFQYDYKPWYEAALRQLWKTRQPNDKLVRSLYEYFYRWNDEDGMLVRGCNWFDERSSLLAGRNTAGIYAKRFLSPDETFCTIGFRYVVRVKQ